MSSNLERYLFEIFDRSPEQTRDAIARFRADGTLVLDELSHTTFAETFAAGWCDDASIEATIAAVQSQHELLIDPHTATAWEVGHDLRRDGETLVVVSTAHPAKFPETIHDAVGEHPPVPERIAAVMDRPERSRTIPADLDVLVEVLAERA